MNTFWGHDGSARSFIGGAWRGPHAKKILDGVGAKPEEVLGRVANADLMDVDRMVVPARTAFDYSDWGLSGREEYVEATLINWIPL